MDSLDRRTLLLGGVVGVAGALAACSGGSSSAAPAATPSQTPTTPSPSPTPSATPSPVDTTPRWPLTGLPLAAGASVARTVVAVKVPDNVREHPQAGINDADIVFVELDGYRDSSGYSGTRLMPVFHSRYARDVAPVRSIRPVDVPLLSPIGAVIGNTGATGWVKKYVQHHREHVEGMLSYMATKGTGSYSIDPARVRTYQGATYYDRAVVCHPKVLAKQRKRFRAGPRQVYFPFAASVEQASTASGQPAVHVRVPWKSGHSYDMGYHWDEASGRYLRSMPWGPHVLSDRTRVTTDNVLVVKAVQRYDKIWTGSGHDEPIHEIIDAKGAFLYAHGGKYVTGTWSKGAVDEPFRFTLTDGSPLLMAPGRTFVELARAKADLVVKG